MIPATVSGSNESI
jgi:hypothetical protein